MHDRHAGKVRLTVVADTKILLSSGHGVQFRMPAAQSNVSSVIEVWQLVDHLDMSHFSA